jgi:hypothetical protein
MVFTVLMNFFLLSPLFLGTALPSVPSFILAMDLKWPRHGAKHIFSAFLYILGVGGSNVFSFANALKGKTMENSISVILFALPVLQSFVLMVFWIVPILIISSLMEKFINICEEAAGKEVSQTKKCVNNYSAMVNGFGLFLIFNFCISQVFIIFTLFLVIFHLIGSDGNLMERVVLSFTDLLTASSLILNITALTLTLDTTYTTLRGLASYLQDQLLLASNGYEKQEILNTM